MGICKWSQAKGNRAWEWVMWKVFLFKYSLPLGLIYGLWSLDVDDFEIILNLLKKIKEYRKEIIIVELGGGVSTIILASFLKRHRIASLLISFEKEKIWIENIDKMIKEYRLEKYIELKHVSYRNNLNNIWFNEIEIENVIKNHCIDLLIVDAPPGNRFFLR